MKKILCICFLSLSSSFLFAQEPGSADLVKSGVASHDSGYYARAIVYYDKAIAKDPDYYLAYYEKSLSLFMSGQYQECADMCKSILKRFPDEPQNKGIYISYGSALDGLGKPDEAVEVYNKGIKKYPDISLLHFNKAVTLYQQKKNNDAADELKSAIFLNPAHASSHQFLAYSVYDDNKLACVLALTNFLLLEPEGERAVKNLGIVRELLGGNVQKKEDNVINITMTMDKKDDKKPDNFKSLELMMSLAAASDLSGENKDKNVAQKLEHQLGFFTSYGSDNRKVKRKTFFHDYYLPLLEDMKKDSLLETASYIICASSDDEAVSAWLTNNRDKVKGFYKWFNAYTWRKED